MNLHQAGKNLVRSSLITGHALGSELQEAASCTSL